MTELTLAAPDSYGTVPSGWTNLSNMFDGNASSFATITASGTVSLSDWDELTDIEQLRSPLVQIDHIAIELLAESTVATTFTFQFFNGSSAYSNPRTVTISSSGTYIVYFAKDIDGLGLDQLAMSKGNIVLKISNSSNSHTTKIYTCDINVNYTESNNSVGTKSYYPEVQSITNVFGPVAQGNSFEPDYVIQADQYNRLADDIILTQKLILLDGPTLTELGDGVLVIGLDGDSKSDRILFNFILRATSNASGLPTKFSKTLEYNNGAATLNQEFSSYWTSWTFQTSALPTIAVDEEFYFTNITGGGYFDPFPTTASHNYFPLHIGGGCGYFKKTATNTYKTLLKFNIIPATLKSPTLTYDDTTTFSQLWNSEPLQRPEMIKAQTVPNIKNFGATSEIAELNHYQIRVLAVGEKR